MLLPAPGLFSTTNCWPSRSDSRWPTSRASTSVGPPAGKPTTSRTGRVGYSSASARSAPTSTNQTSPTSSRENRDTAVLPSAAATAGPPALLHVLDLLRSGAERLLRERGLHELVEIAVEHRAGVRGLHAGA